MEKRIPQGLKPDSVARVDVRAKARTYLRNKSKRKSALYSEYGFQDNCKY